MKKKDSFKTCLSSGKETYLAITLVYLFFGHLFSIILGRKILFVCPRYTSHGGDVCFKGTSRLPKCYLCEDFDLADTGDFYQKVLLRFFARNKIINLKET